jgi:hypothetical protein
MPGRARKARKITDVPDIMVSDVVTSPPREMTTSKPGMSKTRTKITVREV